jgi:hypothetical protein
VGRRVFSYLLCIGSTSSVSLFLLRLSSEMEEVCFLRLAEPVKDVEVSVYFVCFFFGFTFEDEVVHFLQKE